MVRRFEPPFGVDISQIPPYGLRIVNDYTGYEIVFSAKDGYELRPNSSSAQCQLIFQVVALKTNVYRTVKIFH